MLHVDIKAALLYNVMDDEGSNDEIKEDEQLSHNTRSIRSVIVIFHSLF